MTKTLVAAGLIIYRGAVASSLQYLVMQTSYGDYHWTPPKGHVDPGEELLQTAIRETVEESGLSVDHFKIDHDFPPIELKYDVKGRLKTVTYWLAKAEESATVCLSHEHKDYKWAAIDEAVYLVKFPDLQSALRRANSYLCDKYK